MHAPVITRDLALQAYQFEMASSHPRYFLPHVQAPDSRGGDVFRFATLTREESRELKLPFYGKDFKPRGTMVGESSWLWQRSYLDWILDNPFTVTLKARQLGVSWIWDGAILWDLVMFAGIDDLIFSIKEEDAAEQVNRVWDMWLSLPEWFKEASGITVLKPFGNSRPTNRIELEHPDGRVSTLSGMPATKKSGHGRVARRVLFDEMAHQDFARSIWKAIIPAAGDLGGNVGGVSTANGISDGQGGGNFFHEVYAGAGGTDYPNVKRDFLPWWNHPQRTREWYEGLNLDLASKAEQYPEDDDEAFLLTGSPFFDLVSLRHYSRDARAEPLFHAEFQTYANNMASAKLNKGDAGVIEVYRKPEKGRLYGVGVDTATGEGKDYSVAAIIDLQDGAPCAELRMKADYVEFTRQLHFLGIWYNRARIAVEKGGGYGDVVIAYLRDGHEGRVPYQNLYRHRAFDDRKRKLKSQLGYPMTRSTRGKLVSNLNEWVNKRVFPWVTRRFAVEARTFVRRDTYPSPAAADGANDDSIMAWGLALEVFDRYGEFKHDRKKKIKPLSFADAQENQARLYKERSA